MIFRAWLLAVPLFLAGFSGGVQAQTNDVPYWASIRANEAYLRVGPSTTYPIDWVYEREGLPLRVVRVNQGWRLVEDADGVRGWMSASLLSRTRSAIVIGQGLAELRAEPAITARVRWHLEPGVVGELGNCRAGWCQFDVAGHKGWTEEVRLWGAGAP